MPADVNIGRIHKVTIDGSVKNPGVYHVSKGATLGSVLSQAQVVRPNFSTGLIITNSLLCRSEKFSFESKEAMTAFAGTRLLNESDVIYVRTYYP